MIALFVSLGALVFLSTVAISLLVFGPRSPATPVPSRTPPPVPVPGPPGPGRPPGGKPPSAIEVVNDWLKTLDPGQINYAVPLRMKAGVSSTVVVRVSRDLTENLTVGLEDVPSQVSAITVTPLMQVEISGREFDVDPKGPQEQAILPSGISEWRWFVVPTKSGNRTLRITVFVVVQFQGGDEKSREIVQDRVIQVEVNPIFHVERFLDAHWPQVTGVFSALFGTGIILPWIRGGARGRQHSPDQTGRSRRRRRPRAGKAEHPRRRIRRKTRAEEPS